MLAQTGAAVAHCPSSNSALGSGLFPLRRHVERGVRVALGTDVGAGTGFSLLREGLQAYFVQSLLGADGLPLTPAHLLYLATAGRRGGARPGEQVGDLSVGKQFDAVWVRPDAGSTLDVVLGHAADADDALAKVFALGGAADVRGRGVAGGCVLGAGAQLVHQLRSCGPGESTRRVAEAGSRRPGRGRARTAHRDPVHRRHLVQGARLL